MPTKHPRVNIIVEPPLYGAMQDLALSQGVSMSALAKDLIREALETREDVALARLAEDREKTFSKASALSHQQTWE